MKQQMQHTPGAYDREAFHARIADLGELLEV
jgi:hypothetical protein